MCLFALLPAVVLGVSLNDVQPTLQPVHPLTTAGVEMKPSLVKCSLQGSPRLPAFSMDGDFVIGGAFVIHYQVSAVVNNYTTKPGVAACTGRLASKMRYC